MFFEQLLARSGITKAELSRRLGVTESSIYRWSKKPPGYAIAYLNLLVAYNRVRP
jgi:DNA-binding transcriptional regulator YiaG